MRCNHQGQRKSPELLWLVRTPFPWTQTALQAAKEYTDELDGLSQEDKTTLKESFTDLTVDTPRTPLAVGRFKRILAAAGPTAKDMVTEIIKGTSHKCGEGPSRDQGLIVCPGPLSLAY